MTTRGTLSLLQALAGLAYRPLTRDDYMLFADAEAEARIAESSDPSLLDALRTHCGARPAGSVLVVVSGDRIELHGCDAEGDPLAVAIDIGDAL